MQHCCRQRPNSRKIQWFRPSWWSHEDVVQDLHSCKVPEKNPTSDRILPSSEPQPEPPQKGPAIHGQPCPGRVRRSEAGTRNHVGVSRPTIENPYLLCGVWAVIGKPKATSVSRTGVDTVMFRAASDDN